MKYLIGIFTLLTLSSCSERTPPSSPPPASVSPATDVSPSAPPAQSSSIPSAAGQSEVSGNASNQDPFAAALARQKAGQVTPPAPPAPAQPGNPSQNAAVKDPVGAFLKQLGN